MAILLIVAVIALAALLVLRNTTQTYPNGPTVHALQKIHANAQRWLFTFGIIRAVFLTYPSVRVDDTAEAYRRRIELLVWIRVAIVTAIAAAIIMVFASRSTELSVSTWKNCIAWLVCAYLLGMQLVMQIMISRPMTGAYFVPKTGSVDSEKLAIGFAEISSPRRSLGMAFANLLEMVVSWASVYYLCPSIDIVSFDQAMCLSLSTVTTSGFGTPASGGNTIFFLLSSMHSIAVLGFVVFKLPIVLAALDNS